MNLEAVYRGSKLVAPYMARQKWGRIISLASTQAIATEGTLGSYTASKGAIMAFTKSLAWPSSSPRRTRRTLRVTRS